MTQYGLPFDGILTGDSTKAPYSAAEWARQWKLRHGTGVSYGNYGVFAGSGDGTYIPLQVNETNPVSSNVQVQIGAALVDGRFYESTAVETLAINANASGNARIDTIVVRLDYSGQTIRLAVKQGTPAASPARPTLQQDASFWEIPLADIAVANGFATLAQATISQRQRAIQGSSFGWLPYVYPVTYSHGNAYAGAMTLNANVGVIIPLMFAGNMLIQSLSFRGSTSIGQSAALAWDLYSEDTNDGLTAENTLRRVAQSNGTVAIGSGGVVVNSSLNALNPTAVAPGLYWLVLQNRGGPDPYGLAIQAAGVFTHNLTRTKTFAAAGPGQTAELVTSVASLQTSPAIRLNGRVFGEAAAF